MLQSNYQTFNMCMAYPIKNLATKSMDIEAAMLLAMAKTPVTLVDATICRYRIKFNHSNITRHKWRSPKVQPKRTQCLLPFPMYLPMNKFYILQIQTYTTTMSKVSETIIFHDHDSSMIFCISIWFISLLWHNYLSSIFHRWRRYRFKWWRRVRSKNCKQ